MSNKLLMLGILTGGILAGSIPAARAQSLGQHIYIAPTAGIWRWDESAAALITVPDRGAFVWGGRFGYAPMEAFTLEMVVLTGTNTGQLTVDQTTEPVDLRLTQTEMSLIVNFQSIVSRKVYPFLDLGVGLSFQSGGRTVDGISTFDGTKFNFHIGGGLKVELQPRAALRFNIRDTFFSDTQASTGNQEVQVTVDSVELSVALEYRIPVRKGTGSDRLR